MNPKICYISNFYLGERRVEVKTQKNDRLLFLRTQILTLSEFKHNLSKIIFNFNLREEDIPYINDIIALTPQKIQNTPVELSFRENKGFSYGAWSDIFIKHQDEFDYYIFNEDDYFINDHNFDSYLVNTFNLYKNCGYLCAVAYEGGFFPKHAANSFGISSFEVLNKIYKKYGRLLGEMDQYTQTHVGGEVHHNGQVAHTLVLTEFGYDIYDIREKYRVLHSMGNDKKNTFSQLYFPWNFKHLILPSKKKFNEPLQAHIMNDPQFQLPGLNNKYENKVK